MRSDWWPTWHASTPETGEKRSTGVKARGGDGTRTETDAFDLTRDEISQIFRTPTVVRGRH